MNPSFPLTAIKAEASTTGRAPRRKRSAGLLAFSLSVSLALLSLAGCSAEVSELDALRQDLLALAEPAGATTIAAAKDAVADNPSVSIVAQVSNDEHEGFVKGQAAFLVTEVPSGGGSHCDDDSCPFCSRKKAAAANAAVQFVSATGDPLAVDARELFGIQPGDTVVIEGQGEVMPGVDMLQVTAKSIFVRSSEEQAE